MALYVWEGGNLGGSVTVHTVQYFWEYNINSMLAVHKPAIPEKMALFSYICF